MIGDVISSLRRPLAAVSAFASLYVSRKYSVTSKSTEIERADIYLTLMGTMVIVSNGNVSSGLRCPLAADVA
jgi:hypothetical protein